ncbi:hypothetical protein DEU37_1895 [Microbacterium sp. AG790]|uniref:hypothetical protein n=1 Tax=Microbacterium sp. AG790 TaxID=2183995 RepID=UPI000EB048EB|nr:hypothetical protein [Microbacterium sp. AG790]RKS89578.1 hypothetical protein DEU37_1895 [Microbacterium sp. AG790]
MSYLLVTLHEDSAVIVTDTLISGEDATTITGFGSKTQSIPHLNLAIAFTGTMGVRDEWLTLVRDRIGSVRDIKELNLFAPTQLRKIRDRIEEQHGPVGGQRVVHVGFPTDSEKPLMYMYEAANDFEPELFEAPCFVQPYPRTFAPWIPMNIESNVELVTRIRLEDPNRHGIGGELFATRVSNWSQTTQRLHRFPDYEIAQKIIYLNTVLHNADAGDPNDSPHRTKA